MIFQLAVMPPGRQVVLPYTNHFSHYDKVGLSKWGNLPE
jgi:hypothetical protein